MPGTKESTSTARRIEIVEIATSLFLENGFAGTSMSAVANACGVTKASLYHHFPGKDDLFAACITRGYASALDDLEALVETSELKPIEKLERAISTLYDSIVASPVGRMSPLIAEVSRTFPSVAQAFHQDYLIPQQALLGRILDEGTDTGQLRHLDREVFFHIVFGPIVTLSLSREMFATFDDLDEHFPVERLKEGHSELIATWLRGVE
ncbi:TetR/AcrR family transcriptional regulator [Aestuariibius sp. 2305UL40-4]|uniref:TetR/AcrR family transcriptional regulator n=1 Tax=Aestuariibius violaceus TaxID=3234132 RepID=UPI003479DE6C